MSSKEESFKDVNYIDIRKEDGEVIASIPLTEDRDEVIVKNGYTVVYGYGGAMYEDKDGKVYAIEDENERELPKK